MASGSTQVYDFNSAYAKSQIGLFKTLFRLNEETKKHCLPAIVKSYDRATGIVEVLPLAKLVSDTSDGETLSDRPTYKVQVLQMAHGGFVLDFPIYIGETGWLIAGDRNTETARADNSNPLYEDQTDEDAKNKGSERPDTLAMGDFAWGFFIPSFFGNTNLATEDGFVLRKDLKSGVSENGAEQFKRYQFQLKEDGFHLFNLPRTDIEKGAKGNTDIQEVDIGESDISLKVNRDEYNYSVLISEDGITSAYAPNQSSSDENSTEPTTYSRIEDGKISFVVESDYGEKKVQIDNDKILISVNPDGSNAYSFTLAKDKISFSGTPTREQIVVTAVKFESDILYHKQVTQYFCGDVLVGCSEESDWIEA